METVQKGFRKSLIEGEFSARTRLDNIEKLKTEVFDLLIIGGGITGAGTACEATARGIKTALVEMNDFASGTSSKSSKLLHGGVRYLEKFHFKLVFESLKDRNELFKRIPHIARPLSFIAPIYKGYKETLFIMNLGLTVYDFLSFASRNMVTRIHKLFFKEKLNAFEPKLRKEGLKGGIQYYDGACDDARLTVENIKTASTQGTVVANYTKIIGFEKDEKGQVKAAIAKDLISGEEFKINALKILNAAGPWVDSVNKKDNTGYKNRLKPTKGIHIIVPALTNENAILLKTPSKPVRWVFVIPYGEYSIVGTTDTETVCEEGDFSFLEEDNYADSEDIKYLLETVNHYFPKVNYGHKDIISSYAGWRPLIAPPPGVKVSESDISREHEIFDTKSGITCIAGGKLTTYMSMSKQIVDYLVKTGELKKYKNNQAVFPKLSAWNSSVENLEQYTANELLNYPEQDYELLNRLIRKYGTEYKKVYEMMAASPEMKVEIKGLSLDARCYRAEVLYSVFFEMTETLKDFMTRRNRFILKDERQGLDAAGEIALLMANSLGEILEWPGEYKSKWIEEQLQDYRSEVDRLNAFKLNIVKK